MIIFTPNTVIKSADVNLNNAELKTKTDYLTAPVGWVAPTFLNSWVNYGSGFNEAGYYKDAIGWVHLRGLVKNGTSNTAIIFTLPAGYRPQFRELIHIRSNDTGARVDITTSGEITPTASCSTVWVSLDNMKFKAYQ